MKFNLRFIRFHPGPNQLGVMVTDIIQHHQDLFPGVLDQPLQKSEERGGVEALRELKTESGVVSYAYGPESLDRLANGCTGNSCTYAHPRPRLTERPRLLKDGLVFKKISASSSAAFSRRFGNRLFSQSSCSSLLALARRRLGT